MGGQRLARALGRAHASTRCPANALARDDAAGRIDGCAHRSRCAGDRARRVAHRGRRRARRTSARSRRHGRRQSEFNRRRSARPSALLARAGAARPRRTRTHVARRCVARARRKTPAPSAPGARRGVPRGHADKASADREGRSSRSARALVGRRSFAPRSARAHRRHQWWIASSPITIACAKRLRSPSSPKCVARPIAISPKLFRKRSPTCASVLRSSIIWWSPARASAPPSKQRSQVASRRAAWPSIKQQRSSRPRCTGRTRRQNAIRASSRARRSAARCRPWARGRRGFRRGSSVCIAAR